MKHGRFLLLALLTVFLCACRHRRSAEEGALFLQEMKTTGTEKSDTAIVLFYHKLLEAENLYDFTIPQRIELKQFYLELLKQYDSPKAAKLVEEMENLALQANSDSLLYKVRQQFFLALVTNGDTARAIRILRQQEQHPSFHSKENDPIVYYLKMAVYLRERGEWQQSVAWFHKGRPYVTRPYIWYIQIAQTLLQGGQYADALLYTDSIRMTMPVDAVAVHTSYLNLRGQALLQSGHIQEALDWYDNASQTVEASHRQRDNRLYSLEQLKILYDYALLLKQQGQTLRAIELLERIGLEAYDHKYARTNRALNNRSVVIDCYHLLIDCYQAENRMQPAVYYLQKTDSINRLVIRENKLAEAEYRNKYLWLSRIGNSLAEQEKAVARAQQIQQTLCIVIIFLLAVIGAGVAAWQRHRRRLRQLFDLLTEKHAIWLEEHRVIGTMQSLPAADWPDDSCEHSSSFLRILRLMEEKKPWRDPEFDLITLAHLAATNRSQLSALLNSETEKGFSYWLAEYRVNDLIRLVESYPEKSMDELYPLAGFASRTTFFRQFRQVTGLTPKQYKTQINNSCDDSVP